MHVKEASPGDIAQLVARAREGDRQAFDDLVACYAPRIYNLALRVVGSPEEAEDCVQDAFVRAFSRLHTFRGEAAFFTWLYRVALNVTNEAASRSARDPVRASELASADPERPAPDLDQVGSRESVSGRGPEEEVISQERRRVVVQAIRALPERHRTVVVLYDLQGLSYEEIARITHTRVGTVKSRLNRARLALKDRLSEHLELLRD
jgi:RNA polymerase sigma-70 factor (ECF subfamily)